MGLVADWTLDKDLQVNTAAILGHNIKAGCTVKIQANNTNEWSYPAVSETFSYVTPDKMILKFLASTYTYKYWKFTFSGMGAIQIGRMWLGKYLQINPSSLDNFTVNKKRSDTVLYGRNRQKYASPGIGWREFNLSFPKSDTNMMYNLETMYDQVGNHSSFIFCNFDSLRDYQIVDPCYCSLDGGIDFNHIGQQNYNYSLKLSEDK
jgi:hypothetical protein